MTDHEVILLLREQVDYLAKAVTELQSALEDDWWIRWKVREDCAIPGHVRVDAQYRPKYPIEAGDDVLETEWLQRRGR